MSGGLALRLKKRQKLKIRFVFEDTFCTFFLMPTLSSYILDVIICNSMQARILTGIEEKKIERDSSELKVADFNLVQIDEREKNSVLMRQLNFLFAKKYWNVL